MPVPVEEMYITFSASGLKGGITLWNLSAFTMRSTEPTSYVTSIVCVVKSTVAVEGIIEETVAGFLTSIVATPSTPAPVVEVIVPTSPPVTFIATLPVTFILGLVLKAEPPPQQ